ncbi:hypothetical protein BDB00DRAFT_440876 [Zychaea mexicana]|uniref:uncharacterized protein n=1 Tax=Zychaea mexicana TaxID=64656 RepID=UPI0022FDC643|nr:uncharacterized protein BDB00DRAFT_440876 [Zychaea mexicana]KAI9492293.1 hypothetical protein BDB00DRAFT_440876 [Zychaea mexicana]
MTFTRFPFALQLNLAMEFPDSPDYIPDKVVEVTENTDAPMDDRVEKENASVEGEGSVIAKDTVTATSPAEEATVEEETEVALDESNTLLAESQEKQKEPELVEQPESATVTPPTAAKEAEESETAHEIEDELIDYMESEPEDEDEAEPVAVSAVDAEATEKDGHLDEATATAAAADVEIDVSLLDDVQTSTAISTTVSTPVPDQLQQANEDDINAAITRQSPPSSEQEQDTDVFRSDLELNEKETMASHPGDEQQLEVQDQEQGSTADDVFTSSGVQIEEIDGLVEDMDGVEFVWPQDGEKVSSSDQEKEVGPISMEEDGQVASTVPVVGDQDSKVFERDAVDDNDVERVVEDADMAIESQQAIVDVNEPEPQQEEEEAEQETEQTPPVATEDSPEALVAGPAEQHQVGDDFVTKEGSDLPLTDNKENDEMQEIQGTVSVSSPKPEQDDDPSAKDNGDNDDVEALQKEPSPVVEGLDALDDDNTKQQPEQQQQQQNDDEATAAQVETTAVIDEQGEKDVIETTQQASNDDDGNESAIATQVNTARLGQANDKTLTETAMSADNEVARPEDNIQVEEIETVTEIEQAKVTTATATDDVQSESVVVTAGAEEEKGTTAASSPLVTEADVLGTPTEDASEEQQQSLTENIDTSVSTPQLLQSMEDALGQSPSHPVTEDTRVAEQVAETLASEEVTPVAATAAEVDAIHNGNTATTTTMLTFKDPEVDTMVEDEVDSSVAAGADENIEEGKDVEQVQGGSAGMVGTKGEKMEEDMVDRDGDVGMQEVVDEEMDNAEEEQEDGTMDEENAQPAAAAASENTQL